jgi:hypothetical protein
MMTTRRAGRVRKARSAGARGTRPPDLAVRGLGCRAAERPAVGGGALRGAPGGQP